MFKHKVRFEYFGYYLIVLISILGIYFRLIQYFTNRSLWLDEAMLAINIINRNALSLFNPLDYFQGAPIGFLLIQKLITSLFGYSEFVFRLFPLISGILTIPMTFLVANQISKNKITHFVTISLVSFSDKLIYYSSELKQYSTDVLISLIILYFGVRNIKNNNKQVNFVFWGLLGGIAVWLSHPSVFVLAGFGLLLLIYYWQERTKETLANILLILIIWLSSFSAIYFLSLKKLASTSHLINHWQDYFMPFPPWKDINWFLTKPFDLLDDPAGLPASIITMFLLIIGFYSVFQNKRKIAILFISPLIFSLLASVLGKYPFGSRLMLFFVPFIYLTVALGIEKIYKRKIDMNPIISIMILLILGLFLIGPQIQLLQSTSQFPQMGEHIKPALSYLEENYSESEKLYVYYSTSYAFEYYKKIFKLHEIDYFIGIYSRDNPEMYLREINTLVDKRVWFLFTHNCSLCKVNEEEFIVSYLESIGEKIDEYHSSGTDLFLFDL